jgi:hypothetical protein
MSSISKSVFNFGFIILSLHSQIVLPSRKLANANSSSHTSLFRALKGGANNFSIITGVNLAAFPQGEILGGNVIQAISNRWAVFEAFTDNVGAPDYDP